MHDPDFPINVNLETALQDIDLACWQRLQTAVHDPGAAWRLPCVATHSSGDCRLRTVVLRGVDKCFRRLVFHTDLRSGKAADIQQNPDVSLLFYDPTIAVQIVIQGMATVHTNQELADQLWLESAPASLKMYLGPLPPGSVRLRPDCNQPESVRSRIPERTELNLGRSNFAAIVIDVRTMDWLQLSRDGNYRAYLTYQREAGELLTFEGAWLTP